MNKENLLSFLPGYAQGLSKTTREFFLEMLKLKPIIIDVNKDIFTINLDTIKKNISDKTKAIIHVSLNNRYTNMIEFVDYCSENNFYSN